MPFSLEEAVGMAKVAEENGFHGFWVPDEIYFKDPWLTMAICAMATKNIVFGPCVTHVYLRDPTLVAQTLGTLDELSNGRAVCAISTGAPSMLKQYNISLEGTKPVKRLKEAVEVIRKMLTEPQLTYNGEFFKYTGLSSTAKKVGKLPIYIGGMKGPLMFRLAGEIGDGVMLSYGQSREYIKYVLEEAEKGAKAAGRNLKGFDVASALVFCTSNDPDAAKKTARAMLSRLVIHFPDTQLIKHGIKPDVVIEIRKALSSGDISKALDLTTMDFVEKLSVSGSPEECTEKIKSLEAHGLTHVVILALDSEMIGHYAQRGAMPKISGIPTFREMTRLISREIMPHFQ